MTRRFALLPVFVLSLIIAGRLSGQTVHGTGLVIEPVVTGIANPTGMTFVAPNHFLVLEQTTGKIKVVINGVVQATLALDLPVAGGLEPGLLSIVKHPDFPQTPYIYVYYTRSTADGGPRIANRIARFTWNGSTLDAGSEFPVHELPSQNSSHHGGIIDFGLDGTMFAIIGDQHADEVTTNFPSGGPREIGCVVRFNQDGSVPADNPFTTNGWRYIYAYGMRNSFGIAVDPQTGFLWQSENGEPLEEEVNLVRPGMNGGWQDVFGIVAGTPPGLFNVPGSFYANPKFEFKVTAAPTSVTFLTSPVLGAGRWHNMFVAEGNFSGNHRIFEFKLNEARDGLTFTAPALQDNIGNSYAEMQTIVFAENFGIITDVEIGPDGFMYVVDRNAGGRVSRIRPNHPTGDSNADGDLDIADFGQLQNCFNGSTPGIPTNCAASSDIDVDNDVDGVDYRELQLRWSGVLELL